MEEGIFVGHEPFHLRAPQNAQIEGLFLGLCWAIWRLWWAMLGYVGRDWLMEGGIFVGHEPFHLRAPQNAQILRGRLLSQWLGRVPTEENMFGCFWAILRSPGLQCGYVECIVWWAKNGVFFEPCIRA